MRILYSFLLATLLVIGGCSENSPTGPDIIDPPKVGPKPSLSLVDSYLDKIILDSRPIEIEFRSNGVSVFAENKAGVIRNLRKEDGSDHFFLNIDKPTKADEVQNVIAESDKGILTQLIVNLRINDGIDMLLAKYNNRLIQVTENDGYAVIAEFGAVIDEIDVFSDNLHYLVDTREELCILDYTGQNKICENFDGLEANLIDDNNIVFSRVVRDRFQTFTRILSTGEERQVTVNQCEQGVPEPCWNGSIEPVPYGNDFIASMGYRGTYNEHIVGKISSDGFNITTVFGLPFSGGEICRPRSAAFALGQIGVRCDATTYTFAGVYDIASDTLIRFSPWTYSPSFVNDDRWLVMQEGNGAKSVNVYGSDVYHYSVPGMRLERPRIIIF